MPLAKRDPNDKRNFVIIGGGPAGLNCAETLRQSGYTGKITLLANEKVLPYDRTLLSKALPTGDASKFTLRSAEFMKEADIDVVNDGCYSIHTDKKKITLNRGQPIAYDKLLIATGGEPRKMTIPGMNGKNVFVLRSASGQEEIKQKCATSKEIVIVGSSFIGSEIAASLKAHYKDNLKVHLVGRQEYPLEAAFGKEIGKMMHQ